MDLAPPVSIGDPGVALLDADGDGRPDLLISPDGGAASAPAGFFPMTFTGGLSRRSFQPFGQAPSVSLTDPRVRLVDLDGDGLTDILHSGDRWQCWFNDTDPRRAWQRTAVSSGGGPDVDLADPRVRLADRTGDGLQDIVVRRSGAISYWPNLGHGRWGTATGTRSGRGEDPGVSGPLR